MIEVLRMHSRKSILSVIESYFYDFFFVFGFNRVFFLMVLNDSSDSVFLRKFKYPTSCIICIRISPKRPITGAQLGPITETSEGERYITPNRPFTLSLKFESTSN